MNQPKILSEIAKVTHERIGEGKFEAAKDLALDLAVQLELFIRSHESGLSGHVAAATRRAGLGSAATDWGPLHCTLCGNAVSNPVPSGTVVRGSIECPECTRKTEPHAPVFPAGEGE